MKFDDFFDKKNNISIWSRKMNDNLKNSINYVINKNKNIKLSEVIKPKKIQKFLQSSIEYDRKNNAFFSDIATLAEVFCELFDEKRVWIRLNITEKSSCPGFHVDYLKCRLITTYYGLGTDWVKNNAIDRREIYRLRNRKINIKKSNINQLKVGDIALLKGESWINNNGNGIVHRSPIDIPGQRRLYMTIDLVDFYKTIFYH